MEQEPKEKSSRQRILETACTLFVNNGYHGTSTRDITNQIGLSPSTLYSHFKTKEEIFVAVLEAYHPWLIIPSAVENARGKNVDEIVRSAADGMLKEWDKQPDLIRLHLIESVEFRGQHLPELFDNTFKKMTQAVETMVAANSELHTINVDILTRALLGLFFAYLMTDRYSEVQFRTGLEGRAFDYFTDTYLKGIASQSGIDSNKKDQKQEK
ncbi:MAG: TetR/AcrR family transcriptional regulator [Anaerolineaceae bacterium]